MRKLVCFLIGISTFLQAQESKTLYFDFAKEQPNATSSIELNDWIASHKNAEIIKIEGFCDSVDTNLFNKKLANTRIQNVLHILKLNGISISNNLHVNNIGEDFKQSKIQAENRKVTFEFVLKVEPPIESIVIEEEIETPETMEQKIEKERISLIEKFENAIVGDKIVITNIHFQFNSEIINPESEPLLEQLLLVMELNPYLEIKIIGHMCCNPDPKDTKLSFRRASKIFTYLNENGIQQRRLEYIGLGSTESIYPLPEKSEEERVANRRVEIQIIKK